MNYKLFDKKLLDELKLKAYSSSRKRAHFNIHNSYNDSVQKVLICLLEDTYITPHFHKYSHQTELFVVLQGSIKLITFDEKGKYKDIIILSAESDISMIEIYPNTIHTVICISKEALILEIKQGPFDEKNCKEFPIWAIHENSSNAKTFHKQLKKC